MGQERRLWGFAEGAKDCVRLRQQLLLTAHKLNKRLCDCLVAATADGPRHKLEQLGKAEVTQVLQIWWPVWNAGLWQAAGVAGNRGCNGGCSAS